MYTLNKRIIYCFTNRLCSEKWWLKTKRHFGCEERNRRRTGTKCNKLIGIMTRWEKRLKKDDGTQVWFRQGSGHCFYFLMRLKSLEHFLCGENEGKNVIWKCLICEETKKKYKKINQNMQNRSNKLVYKKSWLKCKRLWRVRNWLLLLLP